MYVVKETVFFVKQNSFTEKFSSEKYINNLTMVVYKSIY